ncbi:MAG: hypothetical protein PVH42_08410, partial [Desulfobacterales bacterium]
WGVSFSEVPRKKVGFFFITVNTSSLFNIFSFVDHKDFENTPLVAIISNSMPGSFNGRLV